MGERTMSSVQILVIAVSAILGQLEEGSTREHLHDLEYFVGQWRFEGEDDGQKIVGSMAGEWMHDKNFLLVRGVFEDADGKKVPFTQIVGWDPSCKQIQSWGFGGFGGHGQLLWQKDGKTWTITDVKPWVRWDGGTLTGTTLREIVDDNTFRENSTFKVGDKEIRSTLTATRVP
jgi:hypothetical protein